MMTKTLVWTKIAMEDGRAPRPPELYVNAGDKMELYIVREESEEKQMIYAVNYRTKEHRAVYPDANGKHRVSMGERLVQADPDGWIEWQGGECPLPDDAHTEYRMRGGSESQCLAKGLRWNHLEKGQDGSTLADIIAYRPILDSGEPEPPAWDGEGLPPVGCECIYLGNKERQGEITHHTRYAAVIEYPNGGYDVGGPACFRPILSEEDRDIEEMLDTIGFIGGPHARKKICCKLYRAGYRKTGGA